MNSFQKWMSVLLLVVFAGLLAVPAAASEYAEYEGLQVMVNMDKEHYEEGEAITATITVVNTNSQPVTIVNLEQLIPEGYVLAENSEVATKDVQMQPGQTIELKVTFVGEPADPGEGEGPESFWDKLFYGKTLGVPNLLWVVILVIAVIVFMLLT